MSSLKRPYKSDQQWVKEIGDGSEAAFKELLFKFYSRLCSVAYSVVGSRSRARDVVQEVFLKLWKRRSQWELHNSLKVYLYQAVRNEALNHVQKEKSHRKLKERFAESLTQGYESVEPVSEGDDEELLNLIWEIVDELPERRRFVFFLHRRHGLSYREIAAVMDIAQKTVENHMGEALKDIRARLKGNGH